MHAGKSNQNSQYVMNNQTFESIKEERDLGVTITDSLKFAENYHIAYCVSNVWSPNYTKDKVVV